MAIDTARVKLELASGRSEITAPFHNTAQRRRSVEEPEPAAESSSPVDSQPSAPNNSPIVIDVPLADAASLRDPPPSEHGEPPRTGITRPSWIAMIAAVIAVGVGVWWVMFQRLPQIDPTEVIDRNLSAAQQAMAEGNYTDPPESSAFYYYSAVLALDPQNVEAIAGIDDIADRHLTNARLLLADQRIAEAGVALEKARRVRPGHEGLAAMAAQLRAELRKILAAATAAHTKPDELAKQLLPKASATVLRPRSAMAESLAALTGTKAPPKQAVRSSANEVISLPLTTDTIAERPVIEPPAIASAIPSPTSLTTTHQSAAEPAGTAAVGQDVIQDSAGQGSNIDAPTVANAVPAEPQPTPAVESVDPKLIKMVQPEYPQEALMRGIEGWVDVSLRISAAGNVMSSRVEDTSRGRMFNRAALAAVEQWKYQPRAEGSPETTIRVRLQFRHQK